MTRKLGEGGMGAVYLLQHDSIDQKIAVKVLHGRTAHQDEMVKRFYREAKSISALNHPNVTRLFIFGRSEDGLIYLAMEFVDGVSLREGCAGGAMDELRAIRIMKQVLSALSEAHHTGIIHRDLKPDNIMLTKYRGQRDFVKVLDFGIAKVKDKNVPNEQKLTQAGVVYGTPEYLSPEQAQALELDQRSDIYSLGCILYEMITGQVPFSAVTAVTVLTMHVFEEPRPPSSVNRACSPEMEKIILRAMAKKREQRYGSADEFFDALVVRERQLDPTGKGEVVLPGADLVKSSQVLTVDDVKKQTLARTQVLNASAGREQSAGGAVAPSKSANEEDKRDAMMRKMLIAGIIFAFLLLVVLVVGIYMVWLYKSGGG